MVSISVITLQALLTGLTVMTPRDPWKFVSQSLAHILATNITIVPRYGPGSSVFSTLPSPVLCRDIFVDAASRTLLQRSPLRSLLTDSESIDEEQLEKAYQFRAQHLCQWCFR